MEKNKCCCKEELEEREGSYKKVEGMQKKLENRLNRIDGQLKGIRNMIERGEYCDDVLNQISSVRSALSGLSKVILENHIKHCIVDDIKNGNEEKSVEELIITIDKMLKL